MDLFTRNQLRVLMEKQKGPCVSIYMPTHPTAPESQQNQIRFKNLLKEVGKSLGAIGAPDPKTQDLLGPVHSLLQESLFWRHQSDGLAIFLSSEMSLYYRLPIRFKELVVVTNRFHLKPLLPFLSGDGRFYILALSQNQVRLFQCTRYRISEVDTEGIPESLTEALRYDDPEKQLQFHTGTPGKRGKRSALFHGHGVGIDDTKDKILRYFRQIDRGLRDLLHKEQAPLVLAGVEYLFSIYREANTYPDLIDEGISGNPEGVSMNELHEQAWKILEPYFQKAQKDAAAHYRQFAGSDRASKNLREIVPAAYHGRVELLFVALGLQHWGTFDPHNNAVIVHQKAEPWDEDLLDFATIQTLMKGGTVYAVDPDTIPDNAPSAALFRYWLTIGKRFCYE